MKHDHPHRLSLRLKGYDYAQNGAYSVTICTQGRLCLFGQVGDDGDVQLNNAGIWVATWWERLSERFPGIELDVFVVMPNHLHGVVVIFDDTSRVSLSRLIQWFKTMTTNTYIHGVREHNWESFPGKLWQRSFYDKIIRNDRVLDAIRIYIEFNPLRWALDQDNPANWTNTRGRAE